MILKKTVIILGAIAMLFATACSSDSGGGGGAATTYSISGNLDPGNSTSSFNAKVEDVDLLEILQLKPLARTECSDGYFYSVYCVSFTTPPVAAEGDVDCSSGGAFTVAGMPLNEAVGCFVRRYPSASATTSTPVGAIEIPAANLNGSTDSLVSNGDIALDVEINSSGTISATVVSGGENLDTDGSDNSTIDSLFTGANINGEWALSCNSSNGSTDFSPGHCKCFLTDFPASGYTDEDDCINDPSGPGNNLGNVELGIGIYIYTALTSGSLEVADGVTLPSGTAIKGITIWATSGSPGNYVSLKGSGGEGATNLGGQLAWDNTPLDPTTGVAWTDNSSATFNFTDNNSNTVTINSGNFPAAISFNTATHAQWLAWIQAVAQAAEVGGFECTWGPNDSDAVANTRDPDENIQCMNEVMSLLDSDSVSINIPRVHVVAYCDQNGCDISADAQDSALPYYNAGALTKSRIYVEGIDFQYPNTWADSDDNSAVIPTTDTIGVEPSKRYVFEPLIIYPNGAGFRQDHEDQRHYECQSSGGQVNNSTCGGSGHYELVCHTREELAIKFIGTEAPFDVIFDQAESVVAARLYNHTGSGTNEVSPAGTDVLTMCNNAAGSGGATFMATATKQ